jgi:hypothetical protein
MLIRSDQGTELVNADTTLAFNIGTMPDGQNAVVALGGGLQTVLTIGSMDRCRKALDAIQTGVKQRTHVVDLLGLLGQRPDLTVAAPQIIRPGNGDGRH